MTDARLLDVKAAARYLGVSRTFFLTVVRRLLPGEVDLRGPGSGKALPRWTVEDLDAYIATRRTDRRSA